MEENSNLTAERSLEIITEQIEKSRQAVSKDTGQWLFVSGFITMGTAVVVALINYFTFTPLGHLLWFALPLFIWLAMRYVNRERVPAPESLMGTLVRKTWYTIFTFALVYSIFALIWNNMVVRLYPPDVFVQVGMRIKPIIILLMSVAICITGHILKKRKLVWLGIAGGLLIFIISQIGIIGWIYYHIFPLSAIGKLSLITNCEYIFLFALIGLTIPGWMLKREDPLTPFRGNEDSQASFEGNEMVNGK